MRRSVLFVILFAWSMTPVSAAKIQTEVGGSVADSDIMYISGEITPGDYRKVVTEIIKQGKIPNVLLLSSPGGDVIEAIKIGRLVRSGLINARPDVNGQCNSACTFIVFASIYHISDSESKLGIHRPYYEKHYFAGLSIEEARKEYKRLEHKVISYLHEMKVPTSVIEQMMTVPSDRVIWLSIKDYTELAGEVEPVYEEWIKARCAWMSEAEEKDWDAMSALRGYDYALKRGARDQAKRYEAEAQSVRRRMSEGYREYLTKKAGELHECFTKTVDAERVQYFDKLKHELGAQ